MNRNARKTLAQETLSILEAGGYTAPSGGWVSIAQAAAAAVERTRLFTPEELGWMTELSPAAQAADTCFTVRNETTLDACARLVAEKHTAVLALNFASAKNPGGGFLGGSQAQEESIARSSALYPALLGVPEYYAVNCACGTSLYTDHMVLSPDVPVFRDDDGRLLESPYGVGILTAPAPNAGAMSRNEPGRLGEVVETLRRRIAMVLAIAAQNGYRHLVLGAWGCGVFRNDPAEVADLFAEHLLGGGRYARVFDSVVFAVLDRHDEKIITPFRAAFGVGAEA